MSKRLLSFLNDEQRMKIETNENNQQIENICKIDNNQM